jgi:phosphoserine phosphatase
MKTDMKTAGLLLAGLCCSGALACASIMPGTDPLPSWNEGETKQAIIEFVQSVTAAGGPDFVPASERIATFDNDGTLWVESPIYTQLVFALDRVRALAPEHPEWSEQQPFKAALEGDLKAVVAGGEHALLELLMASHAGMTTDEFEQIAERWLADTRHPRWDRPYNELVYQPMLELLAYLRAHGFETYIASGGGIDFMRPWTERVYGIPPEQVIGSSIEIKLEWRGEMPVLVRQPKIDFIDDKAGKPVAIHRRIGRRPIAAFGNSDGDLQMIQWATAGEGPRFGLIVQHTDPVREYAYDKDSAIGRLDEALTEARAKGWTVVDMRRDWKVVFPFEAR